MDGLKKVQVQLLDAETGEVLEDVNPHFNTSHVSINHNNENEITKELSDFNTSHVSINPTLLSAFPFLLYLKFLENTSFFKFFPSVSQT